MQWDWLPDHDSTTRDIWHVQQVGVSHNATRTLDQSRALYVFRGSAGISGRIHLPGIAPDLFQDERLYARTAEGLWAIRWKAWLKPSLFRQTHESAFINLRKQPALVIDALEWKWYQFLFADGHVERVPISRHFYSLLREEYRGPSMPLLSALLPPKSTAMARRPRKPFESPTKSPESSPDLDGNVPRSALSAPIEGPPRSNPS
ncbi:MAG: hypothetical protein MRJ68_11780 [Nitrospira sp.]|nr:hypothetical protein [Nitrospira sp.]